MISITDSISNFEIDFKTRFQILQIGLWNQIANFEIDLFFLIFYFFLFCFVVATLPGTEQCLLELEDSPRFSQSNSVRGDDLVFDSNCKEAFEKACTFMQEAVASHSATNPVVIYVHCAGGISRSASAVLWFLMAHKRMPLCDAWQYLLEQREFIGPNAGFFNILLDFEKETFGKVRIQQRYIFIYLYYYKLWCTLLWSFLCFQILYFL